MITEKQKLRIIKYQNKCQERGFIFIEKLRKYKNTYIKCKCNTCGYKDNYFQASKLMNKNISCSNCLIIKYKKKCIERGFIFIEHFRENKNTKIKCKCNDCGENNDFYSGNLMNEEVRCSNCLIIKYQKKCEELGYEYIKHFRKNKAYIV